MVNILYLRWLSEVFRTMPIGIILKHANKIIEAERYRNAILHDEIVSTKLSVQISTLFQIQV